MESNTIISLRRRSSNPFLLAIYMLTIFYGIYIIKGIISGTGEIPQLILSVVQIMIMLGVMIHIIISNTHLNLIKVKKDELDFNLIKEPATYRQLIFFDFLFILLTLFLVFIILTFSLFPEKNLGDENAFLFNDLSSSFIYYMILSEMDLNLIPLKAFYRYRYNTDSGEYGKRVAVLEKGSETLVSRNWLYFKALEERSFSFERISLIRYMKINGRYKGFLATNITLLGLLVISLFFVQSTLDFVAGLFLCSFWLLILVTFLLSRKVSLESGQLIIQHGKVFVNKVEKVISNINLCNNRVYLLSKFEEMYHIDADDELIRKLRELKLE